MKVQISRHPMQPAGSDLLASAMSQRNADRMRFVLASHPEAISARLGCRLHGGCGLSNAPPVHVCIAQGWPNGLTVLAHAGADLEVVDSGRGLTPLGYALAKGSLPMVEKLLALGAHVDGCTGSPSPLCAWLGSSDFDVARHGRLWDAMRVARVDVWKSTRAGGGDMPLVEAFLRKGQPLFALQMLMSTPMPQAQKREIGSFLDAWSCSWGVGTTEIHGEILSQITPDTTLPFEFFSDAFCADPSDKHKGSHEKYRRIAAAMLMKYLDDTPSISIDPVAWKNLMQASAPHFASKLQAMVLDRTEPSRHPAASVIRL